MSFENLKVLGWNDFFESDLLSEELKTDEIPARVIQVEKGHYRVALSAEKMIWVELAGKLHHHSEAASDFPVVGDFVKLKVSGDHGHLVKVLNRKTTLKRQAAGKAVEEQLFAANIDYVFIVTSANHDFSPRRLERYLTMVWDSGASPVLILNKADLCENIDDFVKEIEKVSFHSPVVVMSALQGQGIDQLNEFLKTATTSVIVGSSGVGKSTLLNQLLGKQIVKTQDVREEDSKGRHTTTSRSLYMLGNGALLIDTPGIRELQLSVSSDALSANFADIEDMALACKFSDCTHNEEPGCKVKEALANGELDEGRWQSYIKLMKEQRSLEIRKDPAKMSEEKNKWKKIHKALKQKYKMKN